METLREEYGAAFRRGLRDRSEASLSQIYEVARRAMGRGVGIGGLASIHRDALAAFLVEVRPDEDRAKMLESATDLFFECLPPFEAAEKGFLEIISKLELANRTLERQAAEIEAINKELEAFSYSVSHDLRAPLRHIHGFIDLLKKRIAKNLDAQSRHYMDAIADSAERMGALIDALLNFARISKAELTMSRVDVDGIVSRAVKECSYDIGDRQIDWGVFPIPAVRGDPVLLRVAFANLIANAAKFTRKAAQTRIEIGHQSDSARPGRVVVFVKDNGAGFDPKYEDKLFGVFQRLHRAEDFEGTGIGLATVRRIIARHGGETWAKGELGKGATFYLSLPRWEEP